jgi:hypothetical protein
LTQRSSEYIIHREAKNIWLYNLLIRQEASMAPKNMKNAHVHNGAELANRCKILSAFIIAAGLSPAHTSNHRKEVHYVNAKRQPNI